MGKDCQKGIIKWEQDFLHSGTAKINLRGKRSLADDDKGMVVKKHTRRGDIKAESFRSIKK